MPPTAPRPTVPSAIRERLRGASRAAVVAVLLASGLVLAGWALGKVLLQTLGGQVTVKPNTAFGLGVAAVALLLGDPGAVAPARWRTFASRALAAVLAALGVATLVEYGAGVDLGIDQRLFRVVDAASAMSGRMSSVTALEFVLAGVCIFTVGPAPRFGRAVATLSAVAMAALALTALLGYVYGAIPSTGSGHGIQIAIPTAVALLLLAFAVMAQRPDDAWMRVILSDEAGGILARRILPFSFIVPLVLGAARMAISEFAAFDAAVSSAVSAVATMLAFGVLGWWTARVLNAADQRRQVAERERLQLALGEEAARAGAAAERAAREVAESARASAEEAVRERDNALALLDTALNSLPIGFALVDPALRFVRVNAALGAMLGRPADHHVGRAIESATPAMAAALTQHVACVLATGAPILDAEWTADAPGGGAGVARTVVGSYFPVHSARGDFVGVASVVTDVTDRKQLEEQLLQSHKMEAIGRLAGGIAHDFNNMLTAITSYSELLLAETSLAESHRGDVGEIARTADRAAALTRQLLAFSRQQMMKPCALDLNGAVTDLQKMLGRLVGADIEFRSQLDPSLDLVTADAGQMEQVLMNLVVNGRDAMPSGGRLVVETGNVVLDAKYARHHTKVPPGPYVMLSVSDTGCGMSRETQARIFEPFFTTKEAGKGTGLGLATVYGIVKQSGGYIRVYSEPGHGTTFKIYLPRVARRGDGATVAEHPVPEPGRGHETILLVEDDAGVRAVSSRILRRFGYTVVEADSGANALSAWGSAASPFDLVISDMVMPGISGRDLAQRLRELRPGTHVLFMSGYSRDAAQQRSFLESGDEFIEKPFAPEMLARKVRQVLDAPSRQPARAVA